jgi:glycosyltransferase involved in cell wall biosynthesis
VTTPLRVAVVARAVMPLHGLGGLERSVRDLVTHLAARGVEVTLIVPPPARVRREQGADPFASPHVHLRHVRYVSFPFANQRGTTILDRSTSYLAYGFRAGRTAAALARRGDVDVIHGFGASALGATFGTCRAPLVLNPQGMEEFGATAQSQPFAKRIGYAPLRWAVRRVARRADCIIATDVALEPAVERHLHPHAGQMRTIPNGIDLVGTAGAAGPADGLLMRRRHGIDAGETILLSVGRLEFNKGFDVMARALARASGPGSALSATGWRWVLIGTGPYRREIERAVSASNLEKHVMVTGRTGDEDLHAWYEAATLFVHPSRYEGSSLVTLEAMAHRRPIIATTAGGLPDKVHPGRNGWLVEPDDEAGLASAIEDAVSQPQRLGDMGRESRALVEREFAWPVLVDRQIALYQELLARKTGARFV